MTYYIYSFPFEIVREIWDAVMVKGAIVLVVFAIALVTWLEPQLKELTDDVEVAGFFSSLKNLEAFNETVNITEVIATTYNIEISEEVIAKESQTLPQNNFYVTYFSNINNHEKRNEILK